MKMLRKFILWLLIPLGLRRKGDFIILSHFWRHPFFTVRMLRASKSQVGQDVFVCCQLNLWKNDKRKYFFVEFGATDGVSLSNTYILEKIFNWNGLLIEPARVWKQKLIFNRNSKIDFRCIFSETGKSILFNETDNAVYSTIDRFSDLDLHNNERKQSLNYWVDTITLNDLLTEQAAPTTIDYLSIDTEGSEYDILKSVNFDKWEFRIITVEHNYTANRNLIYNLLTANGYKRIFENISLMDDWYVKC